MRNERINDLIEHAIKLLGTQEGDTNHTWIVNMYNSIRPLPRGYTLKKVDAWCAAFISAVGAWCSMQDIILPECSCQEMCKLYEKAGCIITPGEARKGDLVFYNWDGGKIDHVGLVIARSKGVLKVIEGNKSDAVGYRYIDALDEDIYRVARPDYNIR